MLTMTAAPPLVLTDEQRDEVGEAGALAFGPSPHSWGANYETARKVGVRANSVRKWRSRFARGGRRGWPRSPRPGRRQSWLPEGTVAAVVDDTLHASPDDGSTHWTTRTMAARHGIGQDTVARIWRSSPRALAHRPFQGLERSDFEKKVVDVVGLAVYRVLASGGS